MFPTVVDFFKMLLLASKHLAPNLLPTCLSNLPDASNLFSDLSRPPPPGPYSMHDMLVTRRMHYAGRSRMPSETRRLGLTLTLALALALALALTYTGTGTGDGAGAGAGGRAGGRRARARARARAVKSSHISPTLGNDMHHRRAHGLLVHVEVSPCLGRCCHISLGLTKRICKTSSPDICEFTSGALGT